LSRLCVADAVDTATIMTTDSVILVNIIIPHL